jgi:hypothetical protein
MRASTRGLRALLRAIVRHVFGCLVLVPALSAWADDRVDGLQRVRVEGYDIAVSIATPLAVRGGHPKNHPEQTMHGGEPAPGEQHVFVSILDAKTRRRIGSAIVWARLTDGKGSTEEKPLESMTIANTAGYGNYFTLAAARPLTMQLEIRGLGIPRSVRVEFPAKR